MSVLPQLEHDLHKAAERRLAASVNGADADPRGSGPPRGRADGRGLGARGLARRPGVPVPGARGLARRLRVPAIALVCLLAATTITLAASGVILTGAPVRPEEVLDPNVGEGVPAPGASRLLPLRIADPQGGLPWGMRVVRTTRGEICMQVGRVQNGQLGELGIDGAFHDDGRFHPLPADALPADEFRGHFFSQLVSNANTSCQLAGEASANSHVGVEPSAANNANPTDSRQRDLRNIYYGILGPEAVAVSFRAGKLIQPAAVVQGIGAYLIVRRTATGQKAGTGDGSLGTEGDLAPSPPLTAITYRLHGKLCQRGPSLPPGETSHLPDECPWPRYPHSHAPMRELHQSPQARLQIAGNAILGVKVRFKAPFAITSAHQQYTVAIPSSSCTATGKLGYGMVLETLSNDVPRGAPLAARIGYPFENSCGRRAVTVEVFYQHAGEPQVLVGSTVVHAPPGLRLAPPGFSAALRRLAHRATLKRRAAN
jgi:hypothetical protein